MIFKMTKRFLLSIGREVFRYFIIAMNLSFIDSSLKLRNVYQASGDLNIWPELWDQKSDFSKLLPTLSNSVLNHPPVLL